MLKFARAKIKIKKFKNYNLICIEGQKDFKAFDLNIPGDISSAAFFIVLTLLTKDSVIKIKKINLNSTRDGIIKILKKIPFFFKKHTFSDKISLLLVENIKLFKKLL